MANVIVKGEIYEMLDGKLCEIKRQMRQKEGYPFDPARLSIALQAIIEGRFEAVGGHVVNHVVNGCFSVTYDQSLGLAELIKRAVGRYNLCHINSDITQERFPLKGTDVRTINVRVEPFLNGETGPEFEKRVGTSLLASTGDLAGFLHDHPEEVEKWSWVVALSEDSRWTSPAGRVFVPCAYVFGARRFFSLDSFRGFSSVGGVLVLCE